MTVATHPVEIVFEDDEILVLDKPSGLLVLPDRYDPSIPNLYELLSGQYGRIFVIHRIDKETSGLIVFAKTEASHRLLNQQFEARTTEKWYAAICVGETEQSGGEIEAPIAESPGKKGKMKIDPKFGKEAKTVYSVIEHFTGYALVEAGLLTGRTHQIRVHLSSINLPILGDDLYGGGDGFYLSAIKPGYKAREEEKPLLSRVALHAQQLAFVHPQSGKQLVFESGLPKDMRIVLNYLRKFRGGSKRKAGPATDRALPAKS